ncbi:MAG: PAS domain S-box protein [Chloroflexota bacterium]
MSRNLNLKRFFSRPVFDDDDTNLAATLLYTILAAVVGVTVFITFPLALLMPAGNTVIAIQGASALFISVILFGLLRSGKVRLASWLLVTLFWLLTSYSVWAAGGIEATAFSNFMLVVFAAGLLLGARTGILFAVLSALYGLLLVMVQQRGILTGTSVQQTPITLWISNVAIFALVALLQGLSSRTARTALLRARESEQIAKRELEERKQAEENYRAIVENAVFGIFQSTPGGRYLRVNSALARIYGYDSPLDMLETITDIASQVYVNRSDRERFLQILKTDGFVNGFVARNRRKDGSIIWVSSNTRVVKDSQGNFVYFEGTVEDITEKQTMEQARRLSEERYRLISSVMSDYVFSNVQNEKGEIVLNWVAGAFEQISGYSVEEFNARGGWLSTVYPDDLELDARDMAKLRRNERVVSELRTIHKDGSIRWVRNYAHPVWDPQKNELVGIYGAVQDITEQKRIEQERENLIRELEAKNAELEQFTYTVSHDLKAPIITIKGFLGFLLKDARTGDTARLESDIQRISEATDKMHNLLNDLLELSRIGRVMNQPEKIDLGALVLAAREILQGRFQEGGIELIVPEALPAVYGDRQRLLEVVQNLLDNAAKFMGGQRHPRIEIGQVPSNLDGFATFYVRDNGIGIAPEYHDKIFGLFNRLAPDIEGTGVGLALAKRIVEFHGGKIWVESRVGEGATFYFRLPLPPSREAGSSFFGF